MQTTTWISQGMLLDGSASEGRSPDLTLRDHYYLSLSCWKYLEIGLLWKVLMTEWMSLKHGGRVRNDGEWCPTVLD